MSQCELKVSESLGLLDRKGANLTVICQKIILFAISKVNPLEPLPREQTITVHEFAEALDIDMTNAYRQLYEGIDTLYNASVEFNEKDWEVETRWIASKAKRINRGGAVRFKWGEDVHAGLCNLRHGYKSYHLRNIAKLDTSHAIRLYEVLLRYKDTGTRIIAIDELKAMMGIPDKYPRYVDFKRYTVEPSVKQLNTKSNMKVEYTTKKQGRKVTHLIFKFTLENQMKLDLGDSIGKKQKRISTSKVEIDINAQALKEKYGPKRL